MRAIAVSHDCKAELAIAIAKQESRITWNAATVSDVAIAVAHLRPPGQTKAGGFITPKIFDRSFELIVLAREHLIQSRLADEPLVFEDPAVEIRNQPVRLIQHRAINDARGPDGRFESHRPNLASGLFVHHVANCQT